jgi:hypothetical protein
MSAGALATDVYLVESWSVQGFLADRTGRARGLARPQTGRINLN